MSNQIISRIGWFSWYKEKHFVFRFIIIIILIRPIIDQFYYLKSISLFLSPLYWIGIITPLVCVYTILRVPLQKGYLDRLLTVFSILLFFSSIAILFTDIYKLSYWELFLRITMPIYLFFYLRRFINSKEDLEYVLVTFLFSIIFVLLLLYYEVLFSSIRHVTSRGLQRIQADFGDVASYGIYLNLGLIAAGYLRLKKKCINSFYLKNSFYIIIFSLLFSLFKLNHITTIIVYITLLIVYTYYVLKKKFTTIFFVLIFLTFFILLIQPSFKTPELFQSEIEHIQNPDQINQFGHGRLGRLLSIYDIFEKEDLFNILLGLPYTLDKSYFYMYGSSGTHNDFIRIFSLIGLIGLIIYLNILFKAYSIAKKLEFSLQYLVNSTLVFIILTSMSLTPTTYFPAMYIILSIFSYVSISNKNITE